MKYTGILILLAAAAFGADLSGKWNFVWQTEGGERRIVLTLTAKGENVEAQFPDAKGPIPGTVKANEIMLAGKLYSAEAGEEGDFRLKGTVSGDRMQGTASWDEHQMTFTAQRAE